MIKARIAQETKICLVFDNCLANTWVQGGKINQDGITHIIKLFTTQGVPTSAISAICLCDETKKGKASDYKDKLEYVKEVIDTLAFNVLVPMGAEAFTRVVGYKGMQKYIGKSLLSEVYPKQKVIPLQNPLQAKYDPTVMDTILETVALIKKECDTPDLVAQERIPVSYTVLDSIEKWRKFYTHMMQDTVTEIAYDTETKTFDYIKGELLTVQWSHKPGFSYLLPCRFYKDWGTAEWAEIVANIKEIHEAENKTIIGHNKKYDDLWLKHQMGVPLRRYNNFCTQIASFCCNENEANDLKSNAMRLTDMGDYEFELERFIDAYCSNKSNKCKKSDFTYDLIPFDILSVYALQDADATIRLYKHYQEELVREEQEDVFAMMMRFQYLLSVFESNGWPVDLEYAENYLKELDERIPALELELLKEPAVKKAIEIKTEIELQKSNAKRKIKVDKLPKPVDFKLNSTPNKGILFFDVMKLPMIKKTKSGGKSTDKESVDQWIVKSPKYAEFLINFREYGNLKKIKSTYISAFINKSNEGRVRPTYTLTSAKTGRTSAKNPSFQCIPAHSDEAKKVKRAIAAPANKVILGADLQACEMRWCGVYSEDKKLVEIFANGLDIHGSIAKDLFSYITCDANSVKSLYKFERNEVSKRVQFGALYGMGAQALTRNINASLVVQLKDKKITLSQFNDLKYTDEMSGKVLSDYFIKYAGVDAWVAETTEFVKNHGYSLSLFGRKRRVPAVRSEDDGVKATAIRQAVNACIQSAASDSLLMSAYNFQMEIEDKNLPIKILGTIHDAIYIETTEAFRDEAAEVMLRHLRKMPIDTIIPMEAEAEWGKNWAEFSEEFGTDSVVDFEDEEEDQEEEYQEAA